MSSNEGGSRLARRAGLIAVGTLASRVLGALRDAVIAATFPLLVTDVFWLAFVIPNSLRVILAEGAMTGAFVPVLTEVEEKSGSEAAKRFASRFAGSMLVIVLGVVLVGVVFAKGFVYAFASGYSARPEVFADTVRTTRIVFPYVALMTVAALATGALQARRFFTAGAFAPSMLNVAFIVAPITLLPLGHSLGWSGTTVLGVAALVGGSLHVAALIPSLRKADFLVAPVPAFRDPDVRRALALLVPMLLGLGVYQLNVAISRQFLSREPDGSMSFLYYAQRLVEIPQGMFALAVGSAALPSIATTIARGELEEGKKILRDALRLTLFVAIPSSVALVVLAEPIVRFIFGHGRFGDLAIAETSRSLVFQSLGIASVSAVRTVVPMFYGMKETRLPVAASFVNLVVFATTAYFLVDSMGHAGVAVALSAASTAQLIVLLSLLRGRAGTIGLGEVASSAARVLIASCAAGATMFVIASHVHLGRGIVRETGLLAAAGLIGIATFVVTAKVLRVPEVERLASAIRRRVGRSPSSPHPD